MAGHSSAPAAKPADMGTHLTAFLAKSNMKDRANVEKHFANCEAEPDPQHAALFRRLFTKMSTLAPAPIRAVGSLTTQFYIPDGKYRMQVFALEDQRNGTLIAYFPDVLAEAVNEKWLVKNKVGFSTAASPDEALAIEQMDEKNPVNPPEHIKHLTGWNRKAVKLTVKISATQGPQAELVEQLCDLAAKQWTK